MARPQNKKDLLKAAESEFSKLLDTIQETPDFEFPEIYMNRNIKDVLSHLHHWHLLMLEWYRVGMSGEKPEMPSPGYTWKTVPQLNRWIRGLYKSVTLEEAKSMLEESHSDILSMIRKHSDKELFEKKLYPWTGTTSLGAYLISASSSHYDWANKLIKRAGKTIRQTA